MYDTEKVQHEVTRIGISILEDLAARHGKSVADCWALTSLLIMKTAREDDKKTIDIYKIVGEACLKMSEDCRLAGADQDDFWPKRGGVR